MAAPLLLANVDTDIISPTAGITSGDSVDIFSSLDKHAFAPIRYIDGDADAGRPNASFPLNNPLYAGARILITGENFGCGSSRETAPAGIYALGIRCLIGTTFGNIFYNNCFQRGILPIRLDRKTIEEFVAESEIGAFTVELDKQTITAPNGRKVRFEITEYRKRSLMRGPDDISMTLERVDEINTFQRGDRTRRPWIYSRG